MRHALTVLPLMLLLLASPAIAATTLVPQQDFTASIAALETRSGGRLGVSVVSTNGATLLSYRTDERFAMCSTFKALLAAAVLARVDAGQESLDRAIPYAASDLLDYAPITRAHLEHGPMTVSELTAAAVQHSDNTAANLLLATLGGPAGLTRYLRSIGDTVTRLDRNEPSLNSNVAGDPRDTSTPRAMSATLRLLLIGDRLSPASTQQLERWMIGNTTGDAKLRAGFDPHWIVGDKTGSGANGASNDVAIVRPRGRGASAISPFIISVFYTGSESSAEAKNAVIAEVARITGDLLPVPRAQPAPSAPRSAPHGGI